MTILLCLWEFIKEHWIALSLIIPFLFPSILSLISLIIVSVVLLFRKPTLPDDDDNLTFYRLMMEHEIRQDNRFKIVIGLWKNWFDGFDMKAKSFRREIVHSFFTPFLAGDHVKLFIGAKEYFTVIYDKKKQVAMKKDEFHEWSVAANNIRSAAKSDKDAYQMAKNHFTYKISCFNYAQAVKSWWAYGGYVLYVFGILGFIKLINDLK